MQRAKCRLAARSGRSRCCPNDCAQQIGNGAQEAQEAQEEQKNLQFEFLLVPFVPLVFRSLNRCAKPPGRGRRSKPMRSVIAITFALAMTAPALSAAVSGEAVYRQRCAACHDSGNSRVPPRDELKKL